MFTHEFLKHFSGPLVCPEPQIQGFFPPANQIETQLSANAYITPTNHSQDLLRDVYSSRSEQKYMVIPQTSGTGSKGKTKKFE